jgi:hypothetical protein
MAEQDDSPKSQDPLEPVVRVVAYADLTERETAGLSRLFHATYRDADEAYLAKSGKTLRFVALAECGDALVGFSLGDSVQVNLPRMDEPQSVALAGIACIDESMRRRGLFVTLATEAMRAGGAIQADKRFLFTGRMAHVLTYRTMANMSSTTVPATDKPSSTWHREIAVEVASLFKSEIDPETFVVRGSGSPVGFPRIAFETSPEEDALFAQVDRERGDSLLSMCWIPDAPTDW